ncbi:tyrosine-type recombinase/integrase [Thomasclavelia spiroformis]|uniref:tyrosine-type recombinase/integrase n=1 Tax=Thomasclavelia spiroformis TaxID=29348 RepID=UPI0039A0F689
MNSFMARLDENQDTVFNDYIEIFYSNREAHLKLNAFLTKKNITEKNISPYFASYKLVEITPTIVIKWQNEIISKELDDGYNYSNAMLKTIHTQLSAVFNHAIRYYGLRQNPTKVVGRMGKPEREILFWTTDEYKRFIVKIMDKPVNFCAFEVLYWYGIRLGKLLALMRSDFDLKKNKLRINKSIQKIHEKDIVSSPKTVNTYRTIDISKFLADEMYTYFKSLYRLKDDDRVFPITKSYFHHELNRESKAARVKHIRIHDLRHSHVSLLIEKGFSVLVIAEKVGHESIRITYKYIYFHRKELKLRIH